MRVGQVSLLLFINLFWKITHTHTHTIHTPGMKLDIKSKMLWKITFKAGIYKKQKRQKQTEHTQRLALNFDFPFKLTWKSCQLHTRTTWQETFGQSRWRVVALFTASFLHFFSGCCWCFLNKDVCSVLNLFKNHFSSVNCRKKLYHGSAATVLQDIWIAVENCSFHIFFFCRASSQLFAKKKTKRFWSS